MNLYKLTCGIGDYWVVSSDPTAAERKLIKVLNDNDYGLSIRRKVTNIQLIAESKTENNISLTDKHLVL